MFKTTTFRTLAAALTVATLNAAAAQASDLSDCYEKIMGMCEDSISPYQGCILSGMDLCDNQHPEPLMQGALDLRAFDREERLVIKAVLKSRGHKPKVWMQTEVERKDDAAGRPSRRMPDPQ